MNQRVPTLPSPAQAPTCRLIAEADLKEAEDWAFCIHAAV